jgi:hypothetical protein
VAKLKAAAASAGADQSASSKKLELCEEKIASLEGEISRVKQLLRARENELDAAKEEARASEGRAAAAQGKEDNEVRAKDVLALRGDLAAAQAAAAAAAAERDSVLKREADLLQQFEELKRAFHSATEGAAAAAAVAPEVVEKLKKDAEAARLSEMATRGELCLMKEQLEGLELKHHTLQTQMQAEKQRGERLRREKEDLELANSCMKGEMSTMKRVSVNQDRLVRVPVAGLARVRALSLDPFCPASRRCWPTSCAACGRRMRRSSKRGAPSALSHSANPHTTHAQSPPPPPPPPPPFSRSHLDREIQSNSSAMYYFSASPPRHTPHRLFCRRELRESLETENRSLKVQRSSSLHPTPPSPRPCRLSWRVFSPPALMFPPRVFGVLTPHSCSCRSAASSSFKRKLTVCEARCSSCELDWMQIKMKRQAVTVD